VSSVSKGDRVTELAVSLGALKSLLRSLDLALKGRLQVGQLLVPGVKGSRLGDHDLPGLLELVDLPTDAFLVGREWLELLAVLVLERVQSSTEGP
jgi:hypothetical protein